MSADAARKSKSARLTARFASIFASGTLMSRVLGLGREILIAGLVSTQSRGLYIVAFKLPNMLRDIIGEGALNAAFVPVFSETLEKDGKNAFHSLVSAAMSWMLIIALALTALGVMFTPYLVELMNSLEGITGGKGLHSDSMPP